MSDPMATIYTHQQALLLRFLRRRFPALDDATVCDAVQETFVDLLRQPATVERARAHGQAELYRLIRCIAWRKARGELRRRSRLRQVAVPEVSCPPGQPHARSLTQLPRLMAEAVRRFGHRRAPQLRDALEHKLWTGEPDRQVARHFGVPREYLNRAKRFVQDAMLHPGG